MPVVKSETVRLHNKRFVIKTQYSPRQKEFYIILPEYIQKILNQKDVCSPLVKPQDYKGYYDPEEIVRKLLYKAIDEYNEKVKYEKKVIFYSFKSRIRDKDVYPNISKNNSYHPDYQVNSNGVALDLWFNMGYVITNPTDGAEEYYSDAKKRFGDSYPRKPQGLKMMDYTDDRLMFFQSFREYLETGILNMATFFNNNSDKFAELIDMGSGFLLPEPVKKMGEL